MLAAALGSGSGYGAAEDTGAADHEPRWERSLSHASAVHYCLAVLLSLILIALILVLALHPFG